MVSKAAFRLEKYHFSKVQINLENKTSNDLDVSFEPSGKFITNESTYELKINFKAVSNGNKDEFVTIECVSVFRFENVQNFDEIPSYFYRNSIAIVFPYIRAFISTVTLQANFPPIVLPTMNLSSLEKPLKDNSVQI